MAFKGSLTIGGKSPRAWGDARKRQFADDAVKRFDDLGEAVMRENRRLAASGRAPDGSALPRNAPATTAAKRRRRPGLRPSPLRDTGLLLSGQGERKIVRRMGLARVAIELHAAPDRKQIIGYLREKGYRYWMLPRRIRGKRLSGAFLGLWTRRSTGSIRNS